MISTAIADELPSLKDLAAGRFRVGAALGHGLVVGEGPRAIGRDLIPRHFNTVTPENQLKWQPLHPEPGVYRFEQADAFVDCATKHGMWIVGHTLVWDNQTPDWVFEGATREVLLERMREHIHTVVGRYRGRIHAWDVVNEAIDNQGEIRTEKKWGQIIGPDYLEHAFRFAHEADPNAELYYNDYCAEIPVKRDAMLALFKRLRAAGIRIDGLGHQAHISLRWPAIADLEACIVKFHAAGAKVMFTELDMDVLPWPGLPVAGADITQTHGYQAKFDPYRTGLPYGIARRQAARYGSLFQLFVKHHDKIDRVTFWGVTDANTWLNHWPVKGRTNYPLLFDKEGQPKPAFHAVTETLRKTK